MIVFDHPPRDMAVHSLYRSVALAGILACGGDHGSSRVPVADSGAADGQVAIAGDSTPQRAQADPPSRGGDTLVLPPARPPQRTASRSVAAADSAPVAAPAVVTPRETPPPSSPDSATTAPAPPERRTPTIRRPFDVGERLTYEVRLGPLHVGTATMEVRALEPIRGEPAYHAVFRVQGGNRLYRVDDHYESWFGAKSLASLRYIQKIDQGSYERMRTFEIFPDRRVFREEGKPEEPSVADPLDDASFLYFLRTVPLEVGRTYTYERYFRPDRNPVTVRVVRRERVSVPAGQFDAVVVQPTIKTKGIFSEGGRAEVWFADDSTRRIVQIRSRLRFGTLSLHLR